MSAVATQYLRLITLTSEYYLTPIFILGIFGNTANIIVFSQGLLRINGCSWYFIGVSFVNLVVLIVGCLTRLIMIFIQVDLTVKSAFFCKIRTYLIFNSYVLSRHFLCVIAIDRWMITSSNVYFRHRSNPRIARRVIIISAIFWHLINLFIPIGFQPERSGCVPKSNTFYLLMYTIINLFATLIPFIILILFSILTMRNIFKSKIRANCSRTAGTIHPQIDVGNNNLAVVSYAAVLKTRNKDWQFIRLSLIQVIFFIFLNICNAGYTLYQFITKTNGKSVDQAVIDVFIQSIGDDLVYTQSAITFYLYTLASKEFRKVCLKICRRIQRRFTAFYQ